MVASSEKFIISEKANDILVRHGVLVNADGTLLYKGAVASPARINKRIDLKELSFLSIDVVSDKDDTLVLAYYVPPIEHWFEAAIAKNHAGDHTLYFYIPN